MRILGRLRSLSRRGKAADPRSPEPTSAHDQRLPIARSDSPFDRVDAARDERNQRERLRDEARYRRERLDLYRARLYGGGGGGGAEIKGAPLCFPRAAGLL